MTDEPTISQSLVTIGLSPDGSGGSTGIEDYHLQSEIARGGMGIVYRATQRSLNRTVALKVLLGGEAAQSAERMRFRLEAEAVAGLDHPHILPIYEVNEAAGVPYFSMKLLSGGTLSDRLRNNLPIQQLVGNLIAICDAVHHAHQRGILHRDLKPGNILYDADGTPYVADFGLAKRTDTADVHLTRTGSILGTPAYMPPEQARGEKGLTIAADIYSLGAILYQMLAGRPPFQGETVMETVLKVIHDEPVSPRLLVPAADRDLSLVALKCLAKDPADRYVSASSLAADLEAWRDGEPMSVRPPSAGLLAWRWIRRNAWAVVGSGGIGLLAGLSLGLAYASLEARTNWSGGLVPASATRIKAFLDHPHELFVAALVLAFVLTVALGSLVVRVTRPPDRASAAAAGLLAGLVAGFASFMLLGPLSILTSTLELKFYSPRQPQSLGGEQTIASGPIHYQVTENDFRAAVGGAWIGLFRSVLPFALFGSLTAILADYLRQRLRPRDALIAYFEMATPLLMSIAIAALVASIAIGKVVIARNMTSGFNSGPILFIIAYPIGLTALTASMNFLSFRWWWRWASYLGFTSAMFTVLVIILHFM